jgi:hypothetical protein
MAKGFLIEIFFHKPPSAALKVCGGHSHTWSHTLGSGTHKLSHQTTSSLYEAPPAAPSPPLTVTLLLLLLLPLLLLLFVSGSSAEYAAPFAPFDQLCD